MKVLDNVTLVAIDCKNPGAAAGAIKISLDQITPKRALLLTNVDIKIPGMDTIVIPEIRSKKDYSCFVMKELHRYFDTEFVLIIQADGYVLTEDAWEDDFTKYDYIGASWIYDSERKVGNGGFSLRSKKLMTILGTDDFIDVLHPEDQSICILYKYYLEQTYGITFAPEEMADKFAFETKTPATKTFGFHGWFHRPFQETVIIKREGAMGDVIMVEPVLEYFHNNKYRVVLDTLPHFRNLFRQHYFQIHFPDEIDQRLLINAKRYNLDMSYEVRPGQLHLKTYYDFCEVPEQQRIYRNPKLHLEFDVRKECKIFNKYAVIHIDRRPQEGRNINGINWPQAVMYLKELGYTVIQIGVGESKTIEGAIRMHTPGEPFLMWIIAGADLFIGCDSGPSHIASGFNIPSILFFGSVNPSYIHADLRNKVCIHNHDRDNPVCNKEFCWHSAVTTIGVKCYIDNNYPPCVNFKNEQLIRAINKMSNIQIMETVS
jgi:ADP-heptose:LPS heptosyltransferase